MMFGLIIFHLFLLLLALAEGNYGGESALDGQFPYTASLTYDSATCGASIIHERWALTAAHCLRHDLGEPVLRVGTVEKYGPDDTVYKVEKYFVHPDFHHKEENDDLVYFVNDIGLVRLTSSILFNDKVQPIGLATDENNSYENFTATLSGWGRTEYHESSKMSLHYVNVRVISPNECRYVYTDADKNVCTSTEGRRGACYGDSGSPLVADGVQIGIVSTVNRHCEFLKPDLYTKVASFVPWIYCAMSQYGDLMSESES